jgi:hypothetical protein
LLLVILTLAGWPLLATAGQARSPLRAAATPVADDSGLPVVPDPAECVVEPRTADEIRDLAASQAAPDARPDAASPVARPTTPTSRPANPQTVAGIVATVRQFIACVNAGDELRGYALYTDEFVRTAVFVDASLDQPAVPEPPERRVTLLDVVYVREYPDGRVGAVVVIDDPLAPSPAEPYFFVFAKGGDRWLFDEWPATTFLADEATEDGSGAPTVAPATQPTPEPYGPARFGVRPGSAGR